MVDRITRLDLEIPSVLTLQICRLDVTPSHSFDRPNQGHQVLFSRPNSIFMRLNLLYGCKNSNCVQQGDCN